MPTLGTRVSLLFALFTIFVVAGVLTGSRRRLIELSTPDGRVTGDAVAGRYSAHGADACTLATYPDDLRLLPGAQYVELHGGYAALVGELQSASDPARRWLLELSLRDAVEPVVFGRSNGDVLPHGLPPEVHAGGWREIDESGTS